MSKIEQLRKELNDARDELVAKGCKWDPETGNLMDIKPFEIAYQNAIEKVFPGCIWWELTNYWDIFDAMVQGVNDKDMIDEIIDHIDPEAFEDDFGCVEEDADGDPILCEEEAEPEIRYYECEFELAKPEDGTYSICIKGTRKPTAKEAENFCKRDMEILGLKKCIAVDEIDHKDAVLCYDMDNEANFPIFGINEPKLGSIEEEDAEASVKLNEGTSNFRTSDYFDLLVFYTYDEFMDSIKYDPEYPNEEQFTTDLGDGDFHVDYKAFEEAKEDFIEKAWDKNEICVLDEDEQERLQDKLDDFNLETKSIAGGLEEDDAYNLEDIELRIEPGYYSGAYICVEHENYLEYISDKVAKEQEKRISDFLESLRKEFGLTKLGVAWGPASNGETGYKIITDSLKESHDVSLPSTATVRLSELSLSDDSSPDEIEDAVGDWLSNEYGYCHFGFSYDINGDNIDIDNILWDTSESAKAQSDAKSKGRAKKHIAEDDGEEEFRYEIWLEGNLIHECGGFDSEEEAEEDAKDHSEEICRRWKEEDPDSEYTEDDLDIKVISSLEESRKKRKNARFIGNPEAEKSFFNKASGDCAGCSEAASHENKEGKTIKFKNIKAHKRG